MARLASHAAAADRRQLGHRLENKLVARLQTEQR